MIRTLLDRCENIVTEEEDRNNEVEHVKEALSVCGSVAQSTELKYLSKSKSKKQNFYLSKSKSNWHESYLSKSKKVLLKKLLFK